MNDDHDDVKLVRQTSEATSKLVSFPYNPIKIKSRGHDRLGSSNTGNQDSRSEFTLPIEASQRIQQEAHSEYGEGLEVTHLNKSLHGESQRSINNASVVVATVKDLA